MSEPLAHQNRILATLQATSRHENGAGPHIIAVKAAIYLNWCEIDNLESRGRVRRVGVTAVAGESDMACLLHWDLCLMAYRLSPQAVVDDTLSAVSPRNMQHAGLTLASPVATLATISDGGPSGDGTHPEAD